ncbi:MAG: hypothetical protein KatS3mg059_1404 [Thermomicrobiales bacterium]|nr:MAG: hypothetical protein KatS3mg059_1404 [Thermomicrobiales bacterium]
MAILVPGTALVVRAYHTGGEALARTIVGAGWSAVYYRLALPLAGIEAHAHQGTMNQAHHGNDEPGLAIRHEKVDLRSWQGFRLVSPNMRG